MLKILQKTVNGFGCLGLYSGLYKVFEQKHVFFYYFLAQKTGYLLLTTFYSLDFAT